MPRLSRQQNKKPVGRGDFGRLGESRMDQVYDRDGRASEEGTPNPFENINRLIGAISAEIDALKREREAAQARNARIRLGAVYARARLERRVNSGPAR